MQVEQYVEYLLKHRQILLGEMKQLKLLQRHNRNRMETAVLADRTLDFKRLESGVASLEPKYRAVLTDLYIRGLTWQEVGEKQHISQKTLANYRKKAIEQLACMWQLSSMKYLATLYENA
ncbi:MAG: sigma-70 family RNA polymerase sigma factor [Hyphomonadaceae bacterium]|nr:sigma-70 family RNA polymerase sigma factor [Clostridia bacterium]